MNVTPNPDSSSPRTNDFAGGAFVTVGGVRIPVSVYLAPGVDRRAPGVARTVAEIVESARLPLLPMDVLALTAATTVLEVLPDHAPVGKPIPERSMMKAVQEGISFVALAAPGVVRAAGFDPDLLQFAHAVLTGRYHQAFAEALQVALDAGRLEGVAPSAAERCLEERVDAVKREFGRWYAAHLEWFTTRNDPSSTVEGRRDPQLAALFECRARLNRLFLGPLTISSEQAQAELLRAIRDRGLRHRLREDGAGNGGREIRDLMLEAHLNPGKKRSKTCRTFLGDDGRLHRDARGDADRLKNIFLSEKRHRGVGSDDDEDPRVAREDPSQSADPAEAAEAAEAVRAVRELRDRAEKRGPKYVAALEYSMDDTSRAEVASRHGVTEKAIRTAEPWVRAQMEALKRRLG